jgi:uncharacterized membrane protein YtjA (UPF0391 family)
MASRFGVNTTTAAHRTPKARAAHGGDLRRRGTLFHERRVGLIRKGSAMLGFAVAFFIIAIIAAVFGFGGIAAGAASIAKILFFVFLVLFILSLIAGLFRRGRTTVQV